MFPISGKGKRAKGMRGREMMKRKDTGVTILYDSAEHKYISSILSPFYVVEYTRLLSRLKTSDSAHTGYHANLECKSAI
jgi:hypothetical protein